MSAPETAPDELTHPRAKFDGYGRVLTEIDWAYEVDDYGATYGPGLWPWRSPVEGWRREEGKDPQLIKFQGGIRLAPDVEFRAWRNEYVMVRPISRQAHGPAEEIDHAIADLDLTIRPRGMGVDIVHVRADLFLAGDSWRLHCSDLDVALLAQAQMKLDRVLALLAAERARRDIHPAPLTPLTAHARWALTTRPGTR